MSAAAALRDGAGIQVADAVADGVVWLVGMAENHEVGLDSTYGGENFGVAILEGNNVMDQKLESAEHHDLQGAEQGIVIAIAHHGGDGRDAFQPGDNASAADVAGVEDVFDTGEEGGNPWIQFAVGV